jgi:hypothetical protein
MQKKWKMERETYCFVDGGGHSRRGFIKPSHYINAINITIV